MSPNVSLSSGQWYFRQAASSEEEAAEGVDEAREGEDEEVAPDFDIPAALFSISSMDLQAACSHSSSTAAKGLSIRGGGVGGGMAELDVRASSNIIFTCLEPRNWRKTDNFKLEREFAMVERLLPKESGTRSGGPKGASLPARPFPERNEALPLLVFDHILK